ncbi:serine/threonine-protein kinase [Actinocorallia herbida]|uniref:serine/threonine-protein kinase n=1 Tax=Actinocorallia herbida TaxID=58109 RepID=UPI0011CE535D|nr:serine/threonine-protein kinase [Actinocorallia herbida]
MQPGTELSGRYKLTTLLGRGGMGEVWAAEDRDLGRPVAIKIVLAGLQDDAHLNARFTREARTVARLDHPGITAVYDIGHHQGQPYFVMQLLKGTDFKTLLEHHPDGLPVDTAVGLMARVARALAYAHAQGVVHRDIKPANLMELADGGVKICDFGISRQTDTTMTLTAPGSVLGTPAYMAPEQYRGEEPDARTDLYAFGCTLYALLTGGPPFRGPSQHVLLHQHLNETAPPTRSRRPGIPRELDELLQRLLAKDAADRPGSAAEVEAALISIAEGGSRTVPPPGRGSGRAAPDGDSHRSRPRASASDAGDEARAEHRVTEAVPAVSDRPPKAPVARVAIGGLVSAGALSWVLHRIFVDEHLPALAHFGRDLDAWQSALAIPGLLGLAFVVLAVTMSWRRRTLAGLAVAVAAYPGLEVVWRGLPWYLELVVYPCYLFLAFAMVAGVLSEPAGKGADAERR